MQFTTNNQLFFLCHYITTLGIILNDNNPLSSQVENDTVPVLNAFFEYLNKSTNESVAKIHLFNEIRSKINASGYEKLNNFENLDKLCEYIINLGLFAHYGNIEGYVRNIYQNNKNVDFFGLEKILLNNFANNFTTKNICSLRKKSEKLNFLASDRIFTKYVLPVFTEIWKGGENFIASEHNSKKVQRSRRQVSLSLEDNDNDVEMDESFTRNYRITFLSPILVNGLSFLDTERQSFNIIMKNIAIDQINKNENYWLQLWRLESTYPNIVNFLQDLKAGFTISFTDFKVLTNYPTGQVPPENTDIPQTETKKTYILYHIITESLDGFVNLQSYDIPDLYIVFPNIQFTVTNITYEEIENKVFFTIHMRRNDLLMDSWYNIDYDNEHGLLFSGRHSSRMNAIKRAAKFITSKLPMAKFTKVVNSLKNYILSVGIDNSKSPTYEKFGQDFLQYINVLDTYSSWKIDNSKYINDVLYKSKLLSSHNFYKDHSKYKINLKIQRPILTRIFDYYYAMYETDIDVYHKKIRFEDFYRINKALNNTLFKFVPELTMAFLRVALRQCDEEDTEEPLVLYQAFYLSDNDHNRRTYIDANFPLLKLNIPCSKNHDLVLSNVLSDTFSTGIVLVLKIKMKNHCGVANVYEFTKNEARSHVISIPEWYKKIEKSEKTIENRKVIYITVECVQEYTKEEKMISIIKHLNDIYKNGERYYIE